MDLDRLKDLIKKYRENMKYYHDTKNAYNETECRDEYINPLLECFGWDVQNVQGKLPQYKEVVVERFSNYSERPDYTLTLNGVSKLFVEAKKPSVDIVVETEPAIQARKYGWNANHAMVILTNFEDMLIYDTTIKPASGDNARTALYRKYYFEEYAKKFDEINALVSKESVYSGAYDNFVAENFQESEKYHTKIDNIFLEQINSWRLEIGRYLYSNNVRYHDERVLNDVVQEFINQIIFLRICEDRKLPLYKKLYEMTSDKTELQRILTETFRKADKKYNSGLFKGENPIFDLSADVIFNMIKMLYYPNTPYLFNIIEPSVLGKIYESFLAESLTISGGKILLAKKNEYKNRSVVSTPVEIVKYMVKNTLDPICKGKTPKDIVDLRIADIACGSGVFLEEVYQFIIDYCEKWYLENNPEYLLEMENGKKKLPIIDKREILKSCIYGVDIDIHAVEVSKFSLLLKLLENETEPSVKEVAPILPNLDENILSGNSLISDKDVENIELSVDELVKMSPFDWNNINSGGKFDAILGNPPYVKTEDMNVLSGEAEFSIYKNKYNTAYKQFDKYYLFVEQAFELMKDSGVLCYIIPNKFYKIASGQELRNLICGNISEIVDFGDTQLFPDKTIYSAIVTIGKTTNSNVKYSYVKSVTDLWTGYNVKSVEVKNTDLTKNPWSLTTDTNFMQLISDIHDKAVPLSKVVNIFNGIQTSAERPEKFSDKKEVYWFDYSCIESEDEKCINIERFGEHYSIEKDILKPYFKPTKANEKGMNTYSVLSTDKKIIFPYDTKGKLIDMDTMRKKYPGALKYLLDCYDRLVPRCLNNGVGRDVPDATEKTWYKYGRTQALTAFINTPKLIVRILSKEPMYAYDKDNMLIASGGTAGYCAISELEDKEYDLEYIQAWLAHPYTEKYFQMQGSDFENGFTARGTFLLKKLPFIKLNFSDVKQKKLYDDVVLKTRKIYALNEQMIKRPDKASVKVLEKEKNRIIVEIQDLIGKVYRQEI